MLEKIIYGKITNIIFTLSWPKGLGERKVANSLGHVINIATVAMYGKRTNIILTFKNLKTDNLL